MIDVKVVGDLTVRQNMRAIKAATRGSQLWFAVNAGALVVQSAAKANAPRETTSLARSIHVEIFEVTPTAASAIVGTDLEYAAQVEFGGTIKAKNAPYLVFKTRDGKWHRVKSVTQIAQPFLRPALDDNIDEVIAVMQDVFRRLIDAAVS